MEIKSSEDIDINEAGSAIGGELLNELEQILRYWMDKMPDAENGGFYGQRTSDETLFPGAPKGAVLNARILWAFAAAHLHTKKDAYLQMAHRAYEYLSNHFIDKKHGGVYWSVDYKGNPLDKKKQVYALSFVVYGFSEYYRCTKKEEAKEEAIKLFHLIEAHSYDEKNGGYIEAFSEDWKPIEDLRLSDKDANEKKTMNTHLHVLEAYTNLYRIYKAGEVKDAIIELLQVFIDHIIDKNTNHLNLFFDEEWNLRGKRISYGHDIEAAWLLAEAAEVIADETWIKKTNEIAVKIVDAAAEGLDRDGGLWHEYHSASDELIKEKHWWPQAEAMVGFTHAWQVTGDKQYFANLIKSWQFIKKYLIDNDDGEWYWGVNEDHSVLAAEDKAGFWKCPYHNSRACMEVLRRLEEGS